MAAAPGRMGSETPKPTNKAPKHVLQLAANWAMPEPPCCPRPDEPGGSRQEQIPTGSRAGMLRVFGAVAIIAESCSAGSRSGPALQPQLHVQVQ